jgi:hypothetical protein
MNQQQKISLLSRKTSSRYDSSPLLSRSRQNAVVIFIVALSFVVLVVLNHDDGTRNSTTLRQKPSKSASALGTAMKDHKSAAGEKYTKKNLVDRGAEDVSTIVLSMLLLQSFYSGLISIRTHGYSVLLLSISISRVVA